MPRSHDPGHLNLTEVFRRAQLELQAQLALSRLIDHPSTAGSVCESHWLEIFDDYLPKRYRATPAFIVNAAGQRSRQIDIAIYDRLQATPLFPNNTAVHINVESVQAVFEVKPTVSRQWLRDAGEKAASVRALYPNQNKSNLIAGILASTSVWSPATFQPNLTRALASLPPTHQITVGCALNHAAFDHEPQRKAKSQTRIDPRPTPKLLTSQPDQSLMFLLLRLINHLNAQTPRQPPNLLQYLNCPRSPMPGLG